MANPTDFLLNTDYEMDKIVYFTSGQLTSNNAYQYVDNFNLGFIPLVFATFSFTEDFSDTRLDHTSQGLDDILIQIEAFSNGVAIQYKNTINPNQKLYYRVYGFQPTDATANVGSTQKDAKEFILNTDYNYCKLFKKGIATGNTTISHNLGYTPLVLAWQESPWLNPSPAVVVPCWASGREDSNIPSISVTSNNVVINGVPNNNKVHYRIYYDEV